MFKAIRNESNPKFPWSVIDTSQDDEVQGPCWGEAEAFAVADALNGLVKIDAIFENAVAPATTPPPFIHGLE